MKRISDKDIEAKRILGYNSQMSNDSIENLLKVVAQHQLDADRKEFGIEHRIRKECQEQIIVLCKDYADLRKEVKEIIKAYDEYVKALEDENGSMIGLAHVHGWRSSRVELGKKCRSKIKALKQSI